MWSLNYLEGFVKQCQAFGMSPEEASALLEQQTCLTFLRRPHVKAAVAQTLTKQAEALQFEPAAPYLTAETLALAMDCVLKFSEDPAARALRKQAGMPVTEELLKQVPVRVKQAHAFLTRTSASFARMSPSQQMLAANLLGGTGNLVWARRAKQASPVPSAASESHSLTTLGIQPQVTHVGPTPPVGRAVPPMSGIKPQASMQSFKTPAWGTPAGNRPPNGPGMASFPVPGSTPGALPISPFVGRGGSSAGAPGTLGPMGAQRRRMV